MPQNLMSDHIIERKDENYVKCNLCGNDNFTVLYPKNVAQIHQIVKCKTCGLMYANPQGEANSKKSLKADIPEKLPDEINPQVVQKQTVQLKDYKKIITTVKNHGITKGKVLEIGANIGTFLNVWKEEDWKVLGVDPNKGASIYAKNKYNIDILPVTIKKADLHNDQFDVVVMLHVIEHMGNPLQELKMINRVVKQGGILVIETPRYDSLIFKFLRRRERSISCNGHIFFFTIKTIRELLKCSGFDPCIQLDLVGRTLTIDRLLYNFCVMSKNEKIKSMLEKISSKIHADKFVIYLNMRDMLRIYSRKVEKYNEN